MKYTLLLRLLFIFSTSFRPPETYVFICGSAGAKKYHYKETCRGLSSCSHEVLKTTQKKAQGLGLTLCGWED
ncbi:hypothetical protein [Flavobacterium defluvii]|uniref:Uncharacterized protein n=1 Tax=Flavobacterium defluvii TaxID=370979 RepID=A0A1M5SV10_9FLAO|nr:hypothetical protein [Flavobacterium defluvii]SHH42365.1 hypothetical protein SAMN05443663_107230 [Flavobacterium defluvii]